MKKYFRNKELKKLAAQSNTIAYKGLDKASSCLILFSNNSPNKVALCLLLEKMLKDHGIKTATFGLVTKKLAKNEEPTKNYCFQNQLNWKGFPKKEVVKDLTKSNYDVIIDLGEELESPNDFILLSVKAGLRVGVLKNKPYFDLTIEKANNNEELLVNEIEHFLKNITKE
jgi:hypothetical protein